MPNEQLLQIERCLDFKGKRSRDFQRKLGANTREEAQIGAKGHKLLKCENEHHLLTFSKRAFYLPHVRRNQILYSVHKSKSLCRSSHYSCDCF